MTLIKFLQPKKAALDGLHVQEFEVGAEVDAPVQIAEAFIAQGVAELLLPGGLRPQHAPDARPVPDGIADVDEDTEPAAERPTIDATRKVIDAYALEHAGLRTSDLPNKAAALAALDAALDGEA